MNMNWGSDGLHGFVVPGRSPRHKLRHVGVIVSYLDPVRQGESERYLTNEELRCLRAGLTA
jgi:hypothetical protein